VVDWGDVTLYGGRESFIKYYSGRYTPVELNLTIPLPVSGTQIRATITNSVMESPEFRAGVIYAVNNRRDESKGTADIAIIHRGEGGPYVLLGKRETEKAWRFVGGFADPVTEPENATVPPVFNGFDVDAKREAFEETGTDVNSLEYIGSTQVMDWRYRKLDSKIKTVFFLAESMTMAPTDGRDDIKDAKWFNVKDLNIDMFEAAHKPLYAMFMKHLEKRGY
jgi:bifunctional NMN adenylyltransferase/nudix hydrolase